VAEIVEFHGEAYPPVAVGAVGYARDVRETVTEVATTDVEG
jgi:hypothetical protein